MRKTRNKVARIQSTSYLSNLEIARRQAGSQLPNVHRHAVQVPPHKAVPPHGPQIAPHTCAELSAIVAGNSVTIDRPNTKPDTSHFTAISSLITFLQKGNRTNLAPTAGGEITSNLTGLMSSCVSRRNQKGALHTVRHSNLLIPTPEPHLLSLSTESIAGARWA